MLPSSAGKDNKAMLSWRILWIGGVLKPSSKTKQASFPSTVSLKPVGHAGGSNSLTSG